MFPPCICMRRQVLIGCIMIALSYWFSSKGFLAPILLAWLFFSLYCMYKYSQTYVILINQALIIRNWSTSFYHYSPELYSIKHSFSNPNKLQYPWISDTSPMQPVHGPSRTCSSYEPVKSMIRAIWHVQHTMDTNYVRVVLLLYRRNNYAYNTMSRGGLFP